ncbi:hypothetical protein NMY22_g16719 [Coprinellus aureogranulatus]|nr:hypothetical protein NMY22_g16719 [Coprinellus aureogranulatus]
MLAICSRASRACNPSPLDLASSGITALYHGQGRSEYVDEEEGNLREAEGGKKEKENRTRPGENTPNHPPLSSSESAKPLCLGGLGNRRPAQIRLILLPRPLIRRISLACANVLYAMNSARRVPRTQGARKYTHVHRYILPLPEDRAERTSSPSINKITNILSRNVSPSAHETRSHVFAPRKRIARNRDGRSPISQLTQQQTNLGYVPPQHPSIPIPARSVHSVTEIHPMNERTPVPALLESYSSTSDHTTPSTNIHKILENLRKHIHIVTGSTPNMRPNLSTARGTYSHRRKTSRSDSEGGLAAGGSGRKKGKGSGRGNSGRSRQDVTGSDLVRTTKIKSAKLVENTYRRIRGVQALMGYDLLLPLPTNWLQKLPREDDDDDDDEESEVVLKSWTKSQALSAISQETKDLLEEFEHWMAMSASAAQNDSGEEEDDFDPQPGLDASGNPGIQVVNDSGMLSPGENVFGGVGTPGTPGYRRSDGNMNWLHPHSFVPPLQTRKSWQDEEEQASFDNDQSSIVIEVDSTFVVETPVPSPLMTFQPQRRQSNIDS